VCVMYACSRPQICAALFGEKFRIVQRSHPRVIHPLSMDERYELSFAEAFREISDRSWSR
jgi:hypothetical protein